MAAKRCPLACPGERHLSISVVAFAFFVAFFGLSSYPTDRKQNYEITNHDSRVTSERAQNKRNPDRTIATKAYNRT